MKKLLRSLTPLGVVLALALAVFCAKSFRAKDLAAGAREAEPSASAPTKPLELVLTAIKGDSKLDSQIAELQARIKDAPDNNALLERLGWAFVAKARISSDPGFYTLAEQTAKAMEAGVPEDAAAALLRGHVSHAMHRFAEAERIARGLIQSREFVFDYALLGDALMEQGRLAEAIDAYQKMVDLKPCLQTYSRVAYMRWLKGDLRGALEAARLAISAGSQREPEATSWAYTRMALYQLQAGELEKAFTNTDLALQFAPDYAPALLMRGRLFLAEGKSEEAVAPLKLAAEISPLPEYLWTLAEALRASGDIAAADQTEAQLATTGAASDSRTLALFLASRGQDTALALRLASAELESRRDVFTHDAVAWAQFANGDIQAARESIRLALAEGTNDGRLLYHAGSIAAAAGADAEALQFFNKAHALKQMLLPLERQALGVRTAALIGAVSQVSSN